MQPSARETYLESQILTATPQKLQLMLVEGALKFARQTQDFIKRDDLEAGFESLTRCREIVGELLSGVQVETDELTRRVAAVYLFIFQSLARVELQQDDPHLREAIEVLEVERETWIAVCTQELPERKSARPPAPLSSRGTSDERIFDSHESSECSGGNSGGFSLEA